MLYEQLSHLFCSLLVRLSDHHHLAGLCDSHLCFSYSRSKGGIYERKLCKAEEGGPPMNEQKRLRYLSAPKILSSLLFELYSCVLLTLTAIH